MLKFHHSDEITEYAKKRLLFDLYKTFAILLQDEQKYANIFLSDVKSGDLVLDRNKTLRDYIAEYPGNAKNDRIRKFAIAVSVDETMLILFLNLHLTEDIINGFGGFDDLKETVDLSNAKEYFEKTEVTEVPLRKVQMKIDTFFRQFVLGVRFDV